MKRARAVAAAVIVLTLTATAALAAVPHLLPTAASSVARAQVGALGASASAEPSEPAEPSEAAEPSPSAEPSQAAEPPESPHVSGAAAPQGTHGAAVSAVAKDQSLVGGKNDNHGGAVSAVARGDHGPNEHAGTHGVQGTPPMNGPLPSPSARPD